MFHLADYHIPESILPTSTENQARVLDAVQLFAEVEDQDPRLAVVLAVARIEEALFQTLLLYRMTPKQIPSRFMSRLRVAHERGVIDADFRQFIARFRLLRNTIVHKDTRRESLASNPLASLVEKICRPTSIVPVWSAGPIDPDENFTKAVWTASLVGVVAAEVDVFDDTGRLIPKGFNTVCEFLQCQPEGGAE